MFEYGYLPYYIQVPTGTQPNEGPTAPSSSPVSLPAVFRSSTTCPVPTEWLIGAALVGLVVGYAMWGRR